MSSLTLYINTDAADRTRALVAAPTDPSAAGIPVLTFGDTVDLVIYLVTKSGAYHADAGSEDATCALGIGQRDQDAVLTLDDFAPGGDGDKAFMGTLEISGDDLAMLLGSSRAPLTLAFSTTVDGAKSTWLAAPVEIAGSIA